MSHSPTAPNHATRPSPTSDAATKRRPSRVSLSSEPQAHQANRADAWLTERYVFSRHAVVRLSPDGDGFVAETPHSGVVIAIRNAEILKLVYLFHEPTRPADLLDAAGAPARTGVKRLIQELQRAGVIVPEEQDDAEAVGVNAWEVHDAYFHSQTRHGRTPLPIGKGTHEEGEQYPVPAVRSFPRHLPVVELPEPSRLDDWDMPLRDAIETRRSCRSFSGPLPLQDLGDLLHRTCRVEYEWDGPYGRMTHRPYPSGGANYPLEVYPVINQCEGVDAGLYHYNPIDHTLALVAPRDEQVDSLLDGASAAMGGRGRPPVLLTLSARFRRMNWDYHGIAYSLIVKEVGVLYQTLWLVAASMGIGACGLGSGDADVFSTLIGSDYFEESSVGEVAIGPPNVSDICC